MRACVCECAYVSMHARVRACVHGREPGGACTLHGWGGGSLGCQSGNARVPRVKNLMGQEAALQDEGDVEGHGELLEAAVRMGVYDK